MTDSPSADFDLPWKEALAHYLPGALALFFPAVATEIDWGRGYTPELKFGADGVALLPELRQITDPEVLQQVAARIKTATSVDDLRQVYKTPDNG